MMMNNAFLKISSLVFVLLATGCKNVTVTVDSPDETTVYTDVPTFSVSWDEGGTAEDFYASLNGVNITDRFTVTESTATLTDQTLFNELRHNKNLFVASQGTPTIGSLLPSSSTVERTFIADLKGPLVEVITTTETQGVNTVVQGRVSDPSGVQSISYSATGGQSGSITLNEDNTFTLDLNFQDPNEVVFTATDTIGQVSTTTFYRNSEGVIEETLNFRANVEALTVISEVAPDLIAELDIASYLVNSDDPLVDINLLLGHVEVYIDDAAISIPLVDIAPADQAGMDLDLALQIEDLDMQMRLCFKPLFLPSLCQEAFVDSTALFADVAVDLGASNEGTIAVDDMAMDFEITGLEVGLNLFNVDSWGIGIPDILQPVTDALINAFGNLFVDILSPLLDDIITAVLGGVPMAFTMNVAYAVDEAPRTLDVGAYFNEITRDGDQLVMTMGLNNNVTIHENVNDPLGVRTFGFGPATSMITPNGSDTDFVFSLSASFLNHLLHDVYMAGIINADIPMGNINGKPAMARLVPNEPPYLSIEEFNLGMAELHISNLAMVVEVQVDAEDPSAGYTNYFNLNMDLAVPVTLSAGEGTLGVEVSNQLSLTMSNLVIAGAALDDSIINALVNAASGPLVNGVSSALQQITLPAVLGMNIVPVEIWADKNNGTFIIAGDLELAEETPEIVIE